MQNNERVYREEEERLLSKEVKEYLKQKVSDKLSTISKVYEVSEDEIKEIDDEIILDVYFISKRGMRNSLKILSRINLMIIILLISSISTVTASLLSYDQIKKAKMPYGEYRFQGIQRVQRDPFKIRKFLMESVEQLGCMEKLLNKGPLHQGDFVGLLSNGFFISHNPEYYDYKSLGRSQTVKRLKGQLILNTLALPKPIYVQKVSTWALLKQVQWDDHIEDKEYLEIGSYIAGMPGDDHFTKYVISQEDFRAYYHTLDDQI